MADPTKAHGAGPKSTPLFHNGKLYTLGINGIVSAFDGASGKLLWRKPAPSEQPFFGTASSPIADRDVIITHPGNYEPLTAFDANTAPSSGSRKAMACTRRPIIAELERAPGFAYSDAAGSILAGDLSRRASLASVAPRLLARR